jgi:hypothetical protein
MKKKREKEEGEEEMGSKDIRCSNRKKEEIKERRKERKGKSLILTIRFSFKLH